MKLKMKLSLSGPDLSLSPGDIHAFDDPAEAQRLVDAEIAELFEEESPEERASRLEGELAAARIEAGIVDLLAAEALEDRITRLTAELIDAKTEAGIIETVVEETPEERIARLESELIEAKAAVPADAPKDEPPATEAAPAPAPKKPAAKKA